MRRERPLAPSMLLRETPRQTGGGHLWESLVDLSYDSIRQGSSSFRASSMLFDINTREKVWMLYAWCRRCDDLADAQTLGGALGDQTQLRERVEAIRVLTARALDGLPTADPAFDAFGAVAKEAGISRAMADDVIKGFELDAEGWQPQTEEDLLRYCYHVAGAVGVMMALVMGVSPNENEVIDRACDLGIAFQLANIARDVAEDQAGGRCYIPHDWLIEMGITPGEHMDPDHRAELVVIVRRIIDLMDQYAASAVMGTPHLPFRSRWAILSAAHIYTAIGKKVRARGARAWDARVRTSALGKMGHVGKAFIEAAVNRPGRAHLPRWSRADMGSNYDMRTSPPALAE